MERWAGWTEAKRVVCMEVSGWVLDLKVGLIPMKF